MKKQFTVLLIIFIAVIFCNEPVSQTSQPEFTIGAFMNIRDTLNRVNPELYNSFKGTGMNTIVQYAGLVNRQYLTDPSLNAKVIAENDDSPLDYITYYSTGFYSRWESEERQENGAMIGVKHKYGKKATWNNRECWSTEGIIGAKDSIVYGPHYSQEKKYKRGYGLGWYKTPVEYTARFRMALKVNGSVQGSENVCVIKVVHRYSKKTDNCNYTSLDTTLLQRTLTVADFDSGGEFRDFDISEADKIKYSYDSRFFPQKAGRGQMPEQADDCPSYLDVFADNGIQFCVDWLRSDTLCTLYIDYAEVYDNDGWNNFTTDSSSVAQALQNIEDYVQSYSDWPNLVYWYGHDEPSSIDAIVPMKIVDSLVRDFGGAPVITAHTIAAPPYWSQGPYNGEYFHRIYLKNVKADTLLLNDFPFLKNSTIADVPSRLEISRSKLQELHTYNPDFWYVGQSFGEPTYNRKPDSTELKASVMLSLAHGVKGILFWRYDSDSATGYDCIVKSSNNNFDPTELFYVIKNNLVPRLKGKLGNTLCGLNYSGHYAFLKRIIPVNELTSQSMDYLTILERYPPTMDEMNFHAGLLVSKTSSENKYFLLANLFTTASRGCRLSIQSPFPSHTNIRLRNIEGGFDTTFISSIIIPQSFSAGDGKLYQVAPVVKHGGKLIANEAISAPDTLYEDITIENGATLYVNSTYTAKGNIIVKNGGKIIGGNNGAINFDHGFQIFIEGSAQVYGTVNNPLRLNFSNTQFSGIKIKQGGSLNISYCDLIGCQYGILSEPECKVVDIQNVNIQNCLKTGIILLGPSRKYDDDRTPIIKNCSISNCQNAIWVTNYREFIITQNTITNCWSGIIIQQIPAIHIGANIIQANNPHNSGIIMLSSNGNIFGNFIKGHVNGIYLGNSSPNIGLNTIEGNQIHGIYVGNGSVPNLSVQIIGVPPIIFAIYGSNTIRENGSSGFGAIDATDDGSEIYLNESYIRLREGCNSISDDRPSTHQLNTVLLMNGRLRSDEPIYAERNWWGEREPTQERFGNLPVIFEPFNTQPCPFPQNSCEEFTMKTSKGEPIDVVSAINCQLSQLTELELKYAQADKMYLSGVVGEAKTVYEIITTGNSDLKDKLYAYNKLYTISNLIDTTNNYFTNLQTIFNNLAQTVSDSTLIDIFTQNSILCKVSKEEYASAINDFDNIIQQNPESEKAIYAEMDILTTALLMDTTNNQLGKVAGGKYLIKGSADYLSKLNDIMSKNFGKGSKEKEKVIPKDFAISQNYPNPFNPTTKIKYQLPNAAQVSLKVYDILGREIAPLVNEEKPAGYYEIDFNASHLSSGCYFYQIVTKDFVKTMKMLMLK